MSGCLQILHHLVRVLAVSAIAVFPHFSQAHKKCSMVVSADSEAPNNLRSKKFLESLRQRPSKMSEIELQGLSKYKIVFIPGFFNGVQYRMGLKLFEEQIKHLKSQGIEAVALSYPVDHPEKSLEYLVKNLKSDQPLLIISHSMGSLLMMQLLIARPDLYQTIGGWLSVNGTLKGSPVADLASKALSPILPTRLRRTLEIQTERYLQRYEALNRDQIEQMLAQVRHLFVTSWSRSDLPDYAGSSLKFSNRLVQKQGYDFNDGLVPTQNSFLGCPQKCIILPQVDHFSALKESEVLTALLAELLK